MINETIYEDGNGGQLYPLNNDIARTDGLATLAYLEMFSGNVEADTVKENNIGELRKDWWGNDSNGNSNEWINSETERTLQNIELSSASIARIRQSVIKDLKDLEQFGKIDVEVTLPGINKVQIEVTINEPSKKESNTLILIWDASKKEIIQNITI